MTLKAARKVLTWISLPRWNDLNKVYKQTIRVSYLGTLPNAAFLTINLDSVFANNGIKSKRGLALLSGDMIRHELLQYGLPKDLVLNLEESMDRIRNSPFHVHGIVLIPQQLWSSLSSALKKRLSGDYIEHAGNKAVLLKPIHTPGRLAGYVCKDMLKALPVSARRSYSSQNLTAPARDLYSEVRSWSQQIPALLESLAPLLPPRPPRPEGSSALQQLVAEKERQIKERRRQVRRDGAARRWQRKTAPKPTSGRPPTGSNPKVDRKRSVKTQK